MKHSSGKRYEFLLVSEEVSQQQYFKLGIRGPLEAFLFHFVDCAIRLD